MSGIQRALDKLSGKTGRLYVTRGGILGLQIVSLLVLALLMPRDEFGRFAFLWAVGLVSTALISAGGQQFLLRAMSARQGNELTGATTTQALLLILVIPLALCIVVLAVFFGLERSGLSFVGLISLPDIVIALTVATTINLLVHMANALRVFGRTSFAMFVQDGLPHCILLLVAIVLSSLSQTSVLNLLLGFVVLSIIALVSIGVWVATHWPVRALFTSKSENRQRYDPAFWASSLLTSGALNFDIVIGGLFLPASTLGDYQILRRFANLLGLPLLIANWGVAVDIGKAYGAKASAKLQGLADQARRLIALPALVAILALLASLPFIFWAYGISFENVNYVTFSLLLAAAVSNLLFGTNFLFAAQCHLEHHGAIGRFLGLAVGVSLPLALGSSLTAPLLASSVIAAQFCMNAYVWMVVMKKLHVNSGLFPFGKRQTDS